MKTPITIQRGDVLLLNDDTFLDMPAGHWVVWAIEDDDVYISRMGANEDGDFCSTHAIILVDPLDLSFFQETGLTLDLLE